MLLQLVPLFLDVFFEYVPSYSNVLGKFVNNKDSATLSSSSKVPTSKIVLFFYYIEYSHSCSYCRFCRVSFYLLILET